MKKVITTAVILLFISLLVSCGGKIIDNDPPEVAYQKYLTAIKEKDEKKVEFYFSTEMKNKLNRLKSKTKGSMIKLAMAGAPKDAEFIRKEMDGDSTAYLWYEATIPQMMAKSRKGKVKITMVKEETGWKVGKYEQVK